jgi:hypothetical protein
MGGAEHALKIMPANINIPGNLESQYLTLLSFPCAQIAIGREL